MKNAVGLAVAYERRVPEYLAHVLPYIDYLEVTPDTLANAKEGRYFISPDIIEELRALQDRVTLIAHGVGLSIGSHEGYSVKYLELLDRMAASLDFAWHSEHLGYTMVDGVFVGTMLPLPRNDSVLAMLAERIREIQERYAMPFLIENVASLLPPDEGTMDEAEFLNRLTDMTGCGILLDLYNLQCDAHNFGLDIDAFLKKVHLDRVVEIHVTGGVEHRGYRLDVHSRRNDASTLKLLEETLPAVPNLKAVTYELLSEAVPFLGKEVIAEELEALSEIIRKTG